MPCFNPKDAWLANGCNWKKYEEGKHCKPVFTQPRNHKSFSKVQLPCGQCIGCRMTRARHWSIRVMNEAKMHKRNSFITLTYNDENLPENQSLCPADVTAFVKKLRKALHPHKIKTFGGMEYGDKKGRPHYHLIIFGEDFTFDTKFYKWKKGNALFTSKTLSDAWGKGFCSVGSLTYDSAIYVCKYVTKSKTSYESDHKYTKMIDGQKVKVIPEGSVAMSRRPGIGKTWFEKFFNDIFPFDKMRVKNHEVQPPRYYTKLYKKLDPQKCNAMTDLRSKEAAKEYGDPNYRQKLKTKHDVVKAKFREYHLKKKGL